MHNKTKNVHSESKCNFDFDFLTIKNGEIDCTLLATLTWHLFFTVNQHNLYNTSGGQFWWSNNENFYKHVLHAENQMKTIFLKQVLSTASSQKGKNNHFNK